MPTVLGIKEWKDAYGKHGTKGPADLVVVAPNFGGSVDKDSTVDLAPREIPFTISDISEDRDGDTIDPAGWKLDNYLKNPVVLYAHNYQELPVGKGRDTRIDTGKLRSIASFISADLYPFADVVYNLVKGGYLSATSVGFRPMKWGYSEDRRDSWGFGGVDFTEQELLEYSIVPVPSNPNALVEARSKGINVGLIRDWAERVRESTDFVTVMDIKGQLDQVLIDLKESRSFPGATPITFEEILTEIKSGRVLSSANENHIREAADHLNTVLAKMDSEDDSKTHKSVDSDDDDEEDIDLDLDLDLDDEEDPDGDDDDIDLEDDTDTEDEEDDESDSDPVIDIDDAKIVEIVASKLSAQLNQRLGRID